MNELLRKAFYRLSLLWKMLVYQRSGDKEVRCYEASAIIAFRNLLSKEERKRFDVIWELEDEIERSSDNMEFWTWSWSKSAGGVTLRNRPKETRMFGSEGSGSVRVAIVQFELEAVGTKSLFANVYYADGIGPSFIFNNNPAAYFRTNDVCITVGDELSLVDANLLPPTRAQFVQRQ